MFCLVTKGLRHGNWCVQGVAVLELPDYYEIENYVDHHSDMRLDIEDMSYEVSLKYVDRQ